MAPVIARWLAAHGVPTWLLPDYFQLAILALLVGSGLALWLARRDGASSLHTSRAIACAYVGAWLGGYVFESLRALPAAFWTGSFHGVLHPGRAAYGGLLAGIAGAILYLSVHRQPLVPFFDRVAVGTGLAFAFIRTGCFLSGCDYGIPTSHSWGVRFPPHSLAALDHARRGFIPVGAYSLPVHPTELYEAALGLLAAALAAVPLVRGRRDGTAFSVFLGAYAMGRFAIEGLRGDLDRGRLLSLSTAQWVSLGLLVSLLASLLRLAPSLLRLPHGFHDSRRDPR